MKTKPIKILFIEENQLDMELALSELQTSTLSFVYQSVDYKADFKAVIQKYHPQVIVCNYNAIALDGPAVLDDMLAAAQKTPVIIYASDMNEKFIVACIKAGAADFVLKENMKRLPVAISDLLSPKNARQGHLTSEAIPRHKEVFYDVFLNALTEAAFLKDSHLKYVFVNKSAQELLGKSEAEILGKTDAQLLSDAKVSRLKHADEKVKKEKTIFIATERKGDRCFEIRKFAVDFPDGTTGVGGFIHEMISSKTVEPEAGLMGKAFYHSADALLMFGAKGIILSVNPAYCRLTGYTCKEVIGQNWIELHQSELHHKDFYQQLMKTVDGGHIWHGQMFNKLKDKSIYHSEVVVLPLADGSHHLTHAVARWRPVTMEREVELNNEVLAGKYRRLVDSSNIGTFSASLQGELLQVNETFRKMLDFSSIDKMQGSMIQTLFKFPEQWHKIIDLIRICGRVRSYEVEMITNKGNYRHVLMNLLPNNSHVICMVVDETPHKVIEARLVAEKNKAEQNNKLKTRFLASMSHDISVPVNAIQGFESLLHSPELNETEKKEYIGHIQKSTCQLIKMVNDYIELSKVATGKIKSNPIAFDLNTLMQDVAAEFRPAVAKKNLDFTLSTGLDDNLSRIRFDDQKLRQVLVNLLDNAVKFTDKGKIAFGYELNDSILRFFVKDTGRGINPEYQKLIFERFRISGDYLLRKTKGSGLGLPLVKAYIEFLGGNIHVNSQPGKGAEFVFTIPYVPDYPLKRTEVELKSGPVNLHKLRILVAEDDETNYLFMERLLTKANASILRAVSGQEAVDRCAAEKNIDLVLMDINLPAMNGLDATRIIKTKNPGLPVIAVTAYTLNDDRETCLAAGCNEYIAKPVHKEELFMKISGCMNN